MVEVLADNRTGRDEFAQYKQECNLLVDKFLSENEGEAEKLYRPTLEAYEKERQASYDTYISGEETATFAFLQGLPNVARKEKPDKIGGTRRHSNEVR